MRKVFLLLFLFLSSCSTTLKKQVKELPMYESICFNKNSSLSLGKFKELNESNLDTNCIYERKGIIYKKKNMNDYNTYSFSCVLDRNISYMFRGEEFKHILSYKNINDYFYILYNEKLRKEYVLPLSKCDIYGQQEKD